jgi:hypothetical protein
MDTIKQSGNVVVVQESSVAVLVALVGALFTTAFAYTLQCNAQYQCLKDGTCRDFNDGSCSFSNVVSPAGYRVFNLSSTDDVLAVLTRGVCAAGERATVDTNGLDVCARAPAFPNAFNSEAADPSASTDHERACGKWIGSGGIQTQTNYFSFYDQDVIATQITNDIRDEFDPNIVRDDVDRFRGACARMLANDAVPPAAVNAFEHLKTEIGVTDSTIALLRGVGKLASHYCDAPALLGVSFGSDGRFYTTAVDGLVLDSEAASEALYAMDESSTTRELAREFILEMESAPSSLAVEPTQSELNEVLKGSIRGSWLDDALEIQSSFTILTDGSGLTAVSKFLYASKETSQRHARAYLLAVASQCAFAIRSTVTGEFGASSAVQSATVARKRGLHQPASLGRLRFDERSFERFSPVNSSTILDASTITWSRLASTGLASSTSDPQQTCWEATLRAFPDQLDEKVLKKLTSDRLLNDVLPLLVANLKEAVAISLQNGRMSTLVSDPVERANLASNARSVQFKIAGAPRGSQFGRDGEFERPDLSSSDGALLMLLKQARAVFLDRVALAIENEDICEHPPLFPSLARNAYLLTLAPCATLLPGILVPPFASDRYDDASLYGRIGFVIAHEVAHVASKLDLWDETERGRLLVNYTRSTHAEAAADLSAADAVLSTGKTDVETLCGDVSQLWCGREPDWMYTIGLEQPALSHPPANIRGDNVCAFLRS